MMDLDVFSNWYNVSDGQKVSKDEEIARLTRLCEEKDHAFEQLVLQLAESTRINDLRIDDRDKEVARLERRVWERSSTILGLEASGQHQAELICKIYTDLENLLGQCKA